MRRLPFSRKQAIRKQDTQTQLSLYGVMVCLRIGNLEFARSRLRTSNLKSAYACPRRPRGCRQVASYPKWLKWTCRHCNWSKTAPCLSHNGITGWDFTPFCSCNFETL